jgi:hypothetical protein
MNMVITLKSGVQLSFEVDGYETKTSKLTGDLESLTWTYGASVAKRLSYVALDQVAAVHREE